MADYRASEVERIEMEVGETCALDSLHQAVVPPYVMIVPFVELPDGIELVRRDGLGEEGVHGAIFTLRATKPGEGSLRVGFRDLRDNKVVKEKSIRVLVR